MKRIRTKTAKAIAFGKSFTTAIFLAFLLGMTTAQSATITDIGGGECEVQLGIPDDYPNDGSRPSNVPDGFHWEMDAVCIYVWGPCNVITPTFENVVDEHNIQLEYDMEIGRIRDEYNEAVAAANRNAENAKASNWWDAVLSVLTLVAVVAAGAQMGRQSSTALISGSGAGLAIATTAGYAAIAITGITALEISKNYSANRDLLYEIATLEQTRDRAFDAALRNRNRALWRLP